MFGMLEGYRLNGRKHTALYAHKNSTVQTNERKREREEKTYTEIQNNRIIKGILHVGTCQFAACKIHCRPQDSDEHIKRNHHAHRKTRIYVDSNGISTTTITTVAMVMAERVKHDKRERAERGKFTILYLFRKLQRILKSEIPTTQIELYNASISVGDFFFQITTD